MRDDVLRAIGFAVLGLIIGLVVSVLAVGMAGAGHGWTSASVSVVSVIAAPLTGVAWGFRRRRWSLWLSAILVATAIGVDFALFVMTKNEGSNYVENVLRVASDSVVLWAFLFASWQLWASVAALMAMRIRKRTSAGVAAKIP